MGSIQEVGLKIKLYVEKGVGEWGLVTVVLLVAFASFGLGRLSAFSEEKGTVSITEAQAGSPALATGGMYEASKSGTTYFFPWCAAASHLQPEDQIWFKTEEAAQKAGYTPAKNCKGLSS